MTKEQIRDLIFLSQHGCEGRNCKDCMWQSDYYKSCLIFRPPPPMPYYNSTLVSKEAKQIIRNIIGLT